MAPFSPPRSRPPGHAPTKPVPSAPPLETEPDALRDLFDRKRSGDDSAADEIHRAVHAELRALAKRDGSHLRSGPTLQATALVNDVYLRLSRTLDRFEDRSHFLRVAAQTMRQILVDGDRRRGAEGRAAQVAAMSEALERLRAVDEWLAQLVELRLYADQSMASCALVLGISEREAFRWWAVARAFLRRVLDESTAWSAASTGSEEPS
ncbi:MAG: ECF-type sigma factor [Planctomycetota bacterium]